MSPPFRLLRYLALAVVYVVVGVAAAAWGVALLFDRNLWGVPLFWVGGGFVALAMVRVLRLTWLEP